MKKLILILPGLIMFLGLTAQDQKNPKTEAARMLMMDYLEATTFESNVPGETNPILESVFKSSFSTPTIIFDIPIKPTAGEGQQENHEDLLQKEFLNYVTLDRYINLVRAIFDRYRISSIDYQWIETAIDTSKRSSKDIILFEIEKRFFDTSWSEKNTQRYIFEVSVENTDAPKITSVRLSEPDPVKNEVVLRIDPGTTNRAEKLKAVYGRNLTARIKITHEERIYNRTIIEAFDSTGKINLGMVSSRAKILVDTAYGPNGEKFSIPYDWKNEGKQVSQQPVGGFRVPLKPYRWNGWSISAGMEGAAIIQPENNLANFSANSRMNNKTGFSAGAGFNIEKYFNPDDWIIAKGGWVYGIGTGISIHYTRFTVTSEQFSQKAYTFVDRSADTAQILYAGKNFEESMSTYLLKVPVYATVRKKFSKPFAGLRSMSVNAGANLMVPFQSRYTSEGSISRHGRYEIFNNQVITDDDFYNYYSDQPRNYNGDLEYHSLMAEGLIRLNGYFRFSKENPDNSWVVGLVYGFAVSRSSSVNTSDYMISSGNEEYTSLTFSRKRIYRHYFGIRIALNIITYNVN